MDDQSSRDPRGAALAQYLRARAADFSLSADVTTQQHVARAGMVLLDAAELAENLTRTDPDLDRLTAAGCFESMPDEGFRFVESLAIRAAVQRPLAGDRTTGRDMLTLLADAAHAGPGV
jgi:hypothetical protein